MENYNHLPTQQPKQQPQASALSIISLVFAIIALVVSIIPCFGSIAIIIALVPVIASIIVLVQAKKTNEPKGLAIAGLAIGGVALLIGLVWGVLLGAFGKHMKDINIQNQGYYNNMDSIEESYYYEEATPAEEQQNVEIFTEESDQGEVKTDK